MAISTEEKLVSQICKGDCIVLDNTVYTVLVVSRSKGFYRNGKILIVATDHKTNKNVELVLKHTDVIHVCIESQASI